MPEAPPPRVEATPHERFIPDAVELLLARPELNDLDTVGGALACAARWTA